MGCDDVFRRAGRTRPGWQPFISSNRQNKESGPNGRGFNLLLKGATRLPDPVSPGLAPEFNYQLSRRREYEQQNRRTRNCRISKLKIMPYFLTISAVRNSLFDIRTLDLYRGFCGYLPCFYGVNISFFSCPLLSYLYHFRLKIMVSNKAYLLLCWQDSFLTVNLDPCQYG